MKRRHDHAPHKSGQLRPQPQDGCGINHEPRVRSWLLLLFSLGCLLTRAHAQLTVNGIADRAIYNDQATFTVPAQAGYDYDVRLDDEPLPANVAVTVTNVEYHELQVFRTNQLSQEVADRLIRFIVRDSARGSTEDGIPPWTPWPLVNSAAAEFAGSHLKMMVPQIFPANYEIPVVAWIENAEGHAVRVNGSLQADGQPAVVIRRGVGSGFLTAVKLPGLVSYDAHIATLEADHTVTIESNTVWTTVSGTLNGATEWPAGARVAVVGDLSIPSGSTLTIGEGSVIRLDAGVDIDLSGQLLVNGTTNQPVVFIPVNRAQPWGGFLLTASTSQITATGTIFTGSGAVANWFGTGGRPGSHRPEQALFYCSSSTAITLTDCAAIYLAGQLGHAVNGGTFTLTRFLMQHATTGGEYTGASFRVNDAAFIECPDDTTDFVDGDHDSLYFVNGTHGFTNTLFGWTKDDGVDSGGSSGGLLNFQNCWFESVFHEGNSLSGAGKIINHYGDVFINCGQGIESGYDSPVGTLGGCLVTGNLVGGRFGDNYDRTYTGFLRATNSILIYNHRDVWGFNLQDWTYRTSAMDIHSNFLSAPNPHHPDNDLWQPSQDGWRLADFLTTPPGADVGVALVLPGAGATPDFDALANGLPLRLSSFSTNVVAVDYSLDAPSQTIASGTVQFEPGETIEFIPAPTIPQDSTDVVRLTLRNPMHAEVTGGDTFYFTRDATPTAVTLVPVNAVWRYLDTGEDAGTAWRAVDFDDASWLYGPAELGYGDGDEATVVRSSGVNGRIITTYFRRGFALDNPSDYAGLTVRLRRDDGAIVYLNETEIFRSNVPDGPVDYLTLVPNATDDGTTFFSTNASPLLLSAGTNVVAVEIHQQDPTSSDISFVLELTATARPQLRQLLFGGERLLFWNAPSAILQVADDLDGPWSDLASSSPLPMDPSHDARFYRLRQPVVP